MAVTCPPSARAGALGFLALTFAATWMPAWFCRDLWHVQDFSLPARVLACSVLYLAVIGWQPMFAVFLVRRFVEAPRTLDAGLRRTDPDFLLLGLLVPSSAMVVATILDLASGHATPPGTAAPNAASWSGVAAAACVFAASVFIYGQCLMEEIAWRGYFLVRAMEWTGPWRGLILHGLVWGLWYAPILVFTSGGGADSLGKATEFVVTCVLLGILLGWLRLASRSIIPAVTANVLLTLGAGLPILLSGSDVGARGAIYLPVGWLPLLCIACWLAFSRQRDAVVVPRRPRPSAPLPLSRALH